MAALTTHVLDTASGTPAAGMQVSLFAKGNDTPLVTTRTNADGRCAQPLLSGEQMQIGEYVLAFSVAAYFADQGTNLSDPPFLNMVRIDFGISDQNAHYHVPLLVSPYSYSTYRGS